MITSLLIPLASERPCLLLMFTLESASGKQKAIVFAPSEKLAMERLIEQDAAWGSGLARCDGPASEETFANLKRMFPAEGRA